MQNLKTNPEMVKMHFLNKYKNITITVPMVICFEQDEAG